MLVRLRGGKRPRGDAGIATSTLVMTMALLLAGGLLVFGRIANASDMRHRTQVGADAAAIGTLAPLRDQAVTMVMAGLEPDAAGYWGVGAPPEAAAKRHAERNDTSVTEVRLSGMTGGTARVDARSQECQLKSEGELTERERQDLAERRNLCKDGSGDEGIGRFATARAIAELKLPHCVFVRANAAAGATGVGPVVSGTCDGVQVYPSVDRARVTRLFKIRLVDREDPFAYTGAPAMAGVTAAGGAAVVNECAKDGKTPPEDLSFGAAVVAWALCWQGTPYSWGGGNYSGPTAGICCSPGGHDGRIQVGFDCSGLTLYAVYQASRGRIALGHFTGNQLDDPRGRAVPLNALQPGDLVFFGSRPTRHVAIYYGDGKMVEAPQTGDVVKISPLRQPSFARRFG